MKHLFTASTVLIFFICCVLFFFCWRLLYYRLHRHAWNGIVQAPLTVPDTQFTYAADGTRIAYVYFPLADNTGTIILVHGYANPGGKTQMYSLVPELHKLGYAVAVPDLRSFGESDGEKTYMGVREWQDVAAVYTEIENMQSPTSKPIGLMGISMGGVTALITAAETGHGSFVIASVPYATLSSLSLAQLKIEGACASILHPFIRLASLIEFGPGYDRYSALSAVTKINVPVLLIGAIKDQVVNPHDAWLLYENAKQPKTYVEVESPHDVFYYQPELFMQAVGDFLKKQEE